MPVVGPPGRRRELFSGDATLLLNHPRRLLQSQALRDSDGKGGEGLAAREGLEYLLAVLAGYEPVLAGLYLRLPTLNA